MKRLILILITCFGLLISCERDGNIHVEEVIDNSNNIEPYVSPLNLPDVPFDYVSEVFPESFLNTQGLSFFASFNSQELDNKTIELGRVLFYDRNLSHENALSCSSCHLQSKSFAGTKFHVTGNNGEDIIRTAPALINKVFNTRLFWDLRASNLESQVSIPISDPLEMNMEMSLLPEKLQQIPYYPELFYSAYGDSIIDSTKIVRALGQFIRSIKSYQSKYHLALENDFADFTDSELRGKDLFFNNRTKCNQCHMTNNFYRPGALNNGLEENYTYDTGLEMVTGDPEDNGLYKVPSLINVALTGPYMHDGRFQTLEEVIDFYDSGVQAHPYLGDQLTVESQVGGTPVQMNLTDDEKEDLINFLKTLTDSTILNNEWYSNPFVY